MKFCTLERFLILSQNKIIPIFRFEIEQNSFYFCPTYLELTFYQLILMQRIKLLNLFILLFIFGIVTEINAQDCQLTLSGQVLDENTEIPLTFANIYLEEAEKGATTDDAGMFSISGLCAGEYHIRYSHVGCETQRKFINLKSDTILVIELHHHTELLDEIVVHGAQGDNSAQVSNSLSAEKIAERGNENLANVLEQIAGVSTLKNGSGISKPVIHGLYGNRVAILNNGIAQSGQQWGNDHAPEIDPLTAEHISVVKGAGVLAYSGSSLGGIVLVEPSNIDDEPHLHGKASYIYQTNGRGHTTNLQLGKSGEKIAWRATGTLKLIGDRHAPNYFLTNTGNREANFSLQANTEHSGRWKTNFYYSLFNTKLGVLRGAHIGNLTDLESALTREKPFFTRDTFSYAINSPAQTVQHHLLKLKSKYSLNEHSFFTFTYGGQVNNRKEFDVRRGGRSDIPAFSLLQHSHFLEGQYKYISEDSLVLKTGVQLNLTDNTNNPETGILPLIPDYRSYSSSGYIVATKEQKKFFYEVGARYDAKFLEAITISRDLPRRIERFNHSFYNFGLSGGVKYQINERLRTAFNTGWITRNPEINELYSSGLHQGVSGIEEGDRELTAEQSFKTTWLWEGNVRGKFFVQALGYFQQVNNFIYLQPQEEFRLTIRGAFPVFLYKQTDARIYGADVTAYLQPTENLRFTTKYAYVKGQNVSENLPLIFMPPNNATASVNYTFEHLGDLENCAFELSGNYVFEQKNLLADQDFLAPPPAYFLLAAKFSFQVDWKKTSMKFFVRGENLLNTEYRDYLNRLRYFGDDVGRNVVFGGSLKF